MELCQKVNSQVRGIVTHDRVDAQLYTDNTLTVLTYLGVDIKIKVICMWLYEQWLEKICEMHMIRLV